MGKDYSMNFHTKELIGELVTVLSWNSDLKFSGVLKEYFERNEFIVLSDYTVWLRGEDKVWVAEENGDIMVLQRRAWSSLHVPKLNSTRRAMR